MEKKRLAKAMAAAGAASRRACEELIFAGRVQVNGEKVLLPQTMVGSTDVISLDGERLSEQKKIYYMLNKPKGYICSSVRPGKKKIVLDLFEGQAQRLFTVGRLDMETEGLLLVTNDGIFANQVIHPRFRIEKEYLLKAAQEITSEMLKKLSEGALVDHKWVRPVSIAKVRRGTVRIVVREGKKHEVRIIAERAGLDVVDLSRIRIGKLVLGNLPVGMYRSLAEKDKKLLFSR